MAKFTRIYTRTGDDGSTGLIGGQRTQKSSARIAAYGTIDELSSAIGVARASLPATVAAEGSTAALDAWLAWTQDVLFNAGCQLAMGDDVPPANNPSVTPADVAALERAIDAIQGQLPPLNNFIHPGGSVAGAQLHVARTVCRRAERLAVALRDEGASNVSEPIRYLNRLSDALFVWARWINNLLGVSDHRWNPSTTPPE